MQKKIMLTREQVFFLAFLGTIGNIVYCHTWIDNKTDRSAWVASFAGIVLIIPLVIWIMYLGKFIPEGNTFDIIEKGLGKVISKLMSLVFIVINIALAVTQLNFFVQMIKTFFLLYTPSWVIMLVLVFLCSLFAGSGIKTLSRLVELLAALGAFNYFFSFIFAFYSDFRIKYVIPIFDTSFAGFVNGTFFISGNAAECLLLFFILVGSIPDPFSHFSWAATGIIMAGSIFSFAILIIIGMLSPEVARSIAFGGVNASMIIQIGNMIRGLEIFVMASYQFIAIGKVSMCIHCSLVSLKKIIGGGKSKIQLAVIAAIIFPMSILVDSYVTAYYLAVFLASYVMLPFSLMLLVLASISLKTKSFMKGSVPE